MFKSDLRLQSVFRVRVIMSPYKEIQMYAGPP